MKQLYTHKAGHLYKTRQNYFLLNLGSAGLFLNTLFKTSQVQPLSSKSDPGEDLLYCTGTIPLKHHSLDS